MNYSSSAFFSGEETSMPAFEPFAGLFVLLGTLESFYTFDILVCYQQHHVLDMILPSLQL